MFAVGKRSVCTSVSDLTNEIFTGSDDQSIAENSTNAKIETTHGKTRSNNIINNNNNTNNNNNNNSSSNNQKYQKFVLEVYNNFETYSSHENLRKREEEKKMSKIELLNAIDKTLIRFGLNDNSSYEPDSNMNVEEKSATIENDTTEMVIPGIQSVIDKNCENRIRESRKRRQSRTENEKHSKAKANRDREETEEKHSVSKDPEYYALSKSTNTGNFSLRKSKSAPNPFKNARVRVNFGKFEVVVRSLRDSFFCMIDCG